MSNYGKWVPEQGRRDLRIRLKAELQDCHNRQSKDIFANFFLYYQEQTAEHDGGFTFCQFTPANGEYKLGWSEPVRKGATFDQNYNFFFQILRTLPIGSDWR